MESIKLAEKIFFSHQKKTLNMVCQIKIIQKMKTTFFNNFKRNMIADLKRKKWKISTHKSKRLAANSKPVHSLPNITWPYNFGIFFF